jgi:hypothetical protein
MGGSEFVQSIMSEADQRHKQTLKLSLKISAFSSLAQEIIARHVLSWYRSSLLA